VQHTKFDVDLFVRAALRAFYRVCLGRVPLAAALAHGCMRFDGAPAIVRGFSQWFAWRPMAPAVRERRSRVRR
jgi:hypothetical protein